VACIDKEEHGRNYIFETVKNIDRMQRDIGIDQLGECISCEQSLITLAYNTIPITFYMCDGSPFSAFAGIINTPTETRVFRIESIKDKQYVILRLIDNGECTNFTCVLDLDCVCGIQCFQAINCTVCGD